MKKVAERCNLKSTDDLLASLGFGAITLHQVLNRLREEIRLQNIGSEVPSTNIDTVQRLSSQIESISST